MSSPERIWALPVRVDQIPEGGRHFALHADARTRDALASAVGLEALSRLEAIFDVTRRGRGGVHVVGTVSASVRQACVVTLEPIDSEVAEAVDIVFLPREAAAHPAAPLDVTVDAPEPAEPLVDGVVDLGAIAIEFLMLGIDPYPRKADAVFAGPVTEDASGHPFAALAALKKGEREGRE